MFGSFFPKAASALSVKKQSHMYTPETNLNRVGTINIPEKNLLRNWNSETAAVLCLSWVISSLYTLIIIGALIRMTDLNATLCLYFYALSCVNKLFIILQTRLHLWDHVERLSETDIVLFSQSSYSESDFNCGTKKAVQNRSIIIVRLCCHLSVLAAWFYYTFFGQRTKIRFSVSMQELLWKAAHRGVERSLFPSAS